MCAMITLCIVENNQWKEVDCGRRSMVLLDYGMAPKALFMCVWLILHLTNAKYSISTKGPVFEGGLSGCCANAKFEVRLRICKIFY